MKYYYPVTIQYNEVDPDRQVRLYTIENYLLAIAGKVADDLGFGNKYLFTRNQSWILSHLSLEMNYFPTNDETIDVETWIEQNAHMLSTRDYRLYIGKGEEKRQIGRCKSVWAVLDLGTRTIANVFSEPVFQDAIDGEVLEMDRPVKLLPIERWIPQTENLIAQGEEEHKVRYSDCDYNRHCNSCKYLERMIDAYLPEHILHHPLRLDINYTKELHLGSKMRTLYAATSSEVRYQQLDADGHTSASARIALL